MAKLSKKQKLITERIEPGKNYPIEEAVSIISEFEAKLPLILSILSTQIFLLVIASADIIFVIIIS